MAAALLPMLAMGVPAVLSGISSIMDMVHTGKKMSGGKLRMLKRRKALKKGRGGKLALRKGAAHKRAAYELRKIRTAVRAMKRMKGMGLKNKYKKRRGRGVVADTLGKIPLLGSLLGPIAKALGGKIHKKRLLKYHAKRRGKGLSPMRNARPYVGITYGGMLTAPGGSMAVYAKRLPTLSGTFNTPMSHKVQKSEMSDGVLSAFRSYMPYLPKGGRIHHAQIVRKGHYRYKNGKRIHVRPVIGGLLSPAGGALKRKAHVRHIKGKRVHVKATKVGGAIVRKGHYRHVKGKRVHVKAAKVGGYIPYTWRSTRHVARTPMLAIKY